MLLYRKHDCSQQTFYRQLKDLVDANDVDIIAGDFNLKPNAQLDSILSLFDQLVSEPTHLGGSILDHVYVKASFRIQCNVSVSIERIFFSDHESVRININEKEITMTV